jgi:hypothetical protein
MPYILDSGVFISLAREHRPGLREHLKTLGKLVTIKEVCTECRNVLPVRILSDLGVHIEPTQKPGGDYEQLTLLDSFQAGVGDITRADRALIGHAIARGLDVLTTDARMRYNSYREFLRRLDRLKDARLPLWYIPHIEVLRGYRPS